MISKEVCEVILYMFYDHDLSPVEISRLVRTSKHVLCVRTVERIIDRFENSGEVLVASRRDEGKFFFVAGRRELGSAAEHRAYRYSTPAGALHDYSEGPLVVPR